MGLGDWMVMGVRLERSKMTLGILASWMRVPFTEMWNIARHGGGGGRGEG